MAKVWLEVVTMPTIAHQIQEGQMMLPRGYKKYQEAIESKAWGWVSIYEGGLVFFFPTLRSPKPQLLLLHSWYRWKILNEQGCMKLVSLCFWPIVNIEHFFHWKFIWIKVKIIMKFGDALVIVGKALTEQGLMKAIWKKLDWRCGR
jgi:hypothetical protein